MNHELHPSFFLLFLLNTVPPMQSVLTCSIICFPASCFASISCQTVIQYSLTSTSTGPKLNKEKVNDLHTSRAPWHQVCFQIRYILNLLRIMLDAQCENKCCSDANLFCFKCEVHGLNSRRAYKNPSQRYKCSCRNVTNTSVYFH